MQGSRGARADAADECERGIARGKGGRGEDRGPYGVRRSLIVKKYSFYDVMP